jgi:hypothetical protein
MYAQTSTVGSAPESVVAVWENELEMLKPVLVRFDTGKIPLATHRAHTNPTYNGGEIHNFF